MVEYVKLQVGLTTCHSAGLDPGIIGVACLCHEIYELIFGPTSINHYE